MGAKGKTRELRIIGGKWRSLRLRFPADAQIRPTPDRVRETLFNWLAPHIAGARCLDLFAGSGALGLEALSRGAAEVLFVESDAVAACAIERLMDQWDAKGGRVAHADARRFLASQHSAPEGIEAVFDVVFLDPPFGATLLPEVAWQLEEGAWLSPEALVYIESAARAPLPPLPDRWRRLRSGRAGEVGYHLFERASRGAETT